MTMITLESVHNASIKCSELAALAEVPYLKDYLLPHGGVFVRVKVRADESRYQMDRIKDIVQCSHYAVGGRQVDISLKLERLGECRINCLSEKPATQGELDGFLLAVPEASFADLEADLTNLAHQARKLAAHTPTLEQSKVIMRKNTELQRSRANPVVEMASLQRLASAATIPSSPDADLGRLSSVSAVFSPTRFSTQTQAIDFAPLERMRTLQQEISSYVEQEGRSRSGENLRILTERNKKLNNDATARAAENFVKYAKGGNFAQSTLCWEVNDAKRADLCAQYDSIQTKKEEKTVSAATAMPEKSKEEKLSEAAAAFQRKHIFSFDELEPLDAESEVTFTTPTKMLVGTVGKRSRSQLDEASLTQTQATQPR